MKRMMVLVPALAFLACLAVAEEIPASAPIGSAGVRMDLSLGGAVPLSWYDGGPTLAQLGWSAGAGLEYDLQSWIPFRFEMAGFGETASSISTGGELYKGWNGLRFAAYAGYRSPSVRFLGGSRFDILGGGALTAAGYSDTNLAFAYPSLLLVARADLRPGAGNGLVIGLPLEYMFRGELSTFAAGAFLAWRMGPLASGPAQGQVRK